MIKEKVRHILTDCDGVLCNWDRSFRQFMKDRGMPQLPDTDSHYSISTRHGITPDVALVCIAEFNQSEHIANLQPFADAKEYVGKLVDLGFSFTAITSLSNHPAAKQHRVANLTNLFGDIFEEITCLHMGTNKYEELTRWQDSGMFWIEDHPEQVEAGYRAGLRPILISHPHNSNYSTELFPTVDHSEPWKQIYGMICEDYGISR